MKSFETHSIPIPPENMSPISRHWSEIIKLPYIPYDMDERKSLLAHAFEELAPYIERHQEMNK